MSHDLIHMHPSAETPGQIANRYASAVVFADYQQRLASNSTRRQKAELSNFATYLVAAGVSLSADELLSDPQSWAPITHGLVDGFVRWLLARGYAIGSINLHLSTVKAYCKLAARAGTLPIEQVALIRMVEGYSHRQGRNVDEKRPVSRIGRKKAEPVIVTSEQAKLLKDQPGTPQGWRDRLLMCLLLDHGLRCSEVAGLLVTDVLEDGVLGFYRKKVDKDQKHELTRETMIALKKYLEEASPEKYLLMGSRKGGQLVGRMGERSITARVRVLCERIGIKQASAHDGRHAWATFAVAGGTDIKALQDAGGWNSPAMPLRYAASQQIANKGVKLG